MSELKELVDRYVAVWNEPDAQRRAQAVAQLWAAGSVHIVQPPRETRDAAAALGLFAAFEAHGHAALTERVARAYEEFVAPGEFRFRARGDAARLRDLVTFRWEMVPAGGGEVAAVGLEVVVLDGDGRIRTDYQFIES